MADGPSINYVAINGTDPRGTVPAASKLAVLLFKEAELFAANDYNSQIRVPTFCMDFCGENGRVETIFKGKSYYLNWKCDTKEPLEE